MESRSKGPAKKDDGGEVAKIIEDKLVDQGTQTTATSPTPSSPASPSPSSPSSPSSPLPFSSSSSSLTSSQNFDVNLVEVIAQVCELQVDHNSQSASFEERIRETKN